MAKLYYDQDCDLSVLKSSTVAVIGYGSQGRAQAQNMLDSGLKVIIGLKAGSTSTAEAKADGFEVVDVATAAERAAREHRVKGRARLDLLAEGHLIAARAGAENEPVAVLFKLGAQIDPALQGP